MADDLGALAVYPVTVLAAGWTGGSRAALGVGRDLPVVAVYGLLVLCGILILVGAGAIAWRQYRRQPASGEWPVISAPMPAADVDPREAARDAAALRGAANRAVAAAAQARQQSEQAHRALEVAERAYEEAHRAQEAAREAVARAGTPVPLAGVEAERDLLRAALGAYRRGHISAEDLHRVWQGAHGWNPSRDDAEHALLRLRADEAAARQAYHMAVAAARTARRAEHVADVAARALADEAAQAAAEWERIRPTRRHMR